ncbi:uncharacterized protein LOC116207404 [Punica granatum]|uniref:Uncharacterized protein LOC116207404 n=1 Tax=Punica granatum TaxID=22663 RepID=A0A6P8DFX5_PUNGR|nr:uncharacterized protein LOC116207404 [Punica granatum]
MPSDRADLSSDQDKEHKHKKLDNEVRDMFSAITSRIFRLHNVGGSSHHRGDGEDDRGIRVITLAGNNMGATFRGGQDEKMGGGPEEENDDDALGTYVNSNFQAINNSIMMGGSYSGNDPGVHAEITDFTENYLYDTVFLDIRSLK